MGLLEGCRSSFGHDHHHCGSIVINSDTAADARGLVCGTVVVR